MKQTKQAVKNVQNEILALAQRFVAIPSTAENMPALERVLEEALKPLTSYTVEYFTKNGVRSALIYREKQRPKKFKVLFNAHLDIIPGKAEQYTPRVVGTKLYGAGSMDMKANAAAMIMAFRDMAERVEYPLALQLVTDEEVGGGHGTRYQVESGVRADFVIAGEPTNFEIVHKAKGVLWLKISARGISAHGAYPWRGDNAILTMNAFLNRLFKRYPLPKKEVWATTVNVARIETNNQALNKIPDTCSAYLDIRFVEKDAKTILPTIKKLLPKGFVIEVLENEPVLFTDKAHRYLQTLSRLQQKATGKKTVIRGANGTSDARHFARVGGKGIEFGPIGGDIGGDKEWVSIPSLGKYYEILTEFLVEVEE